MTDKHHEHTATGMCIMLNSSFAGSLLTSAKPMVNEKKRIVIAGGGFGGLFTALDLAGAGDVTLISDEDHFLFAPMLYEYLSGEVEEWHIAPRYKELLDESVNLVQDKVANIDL